MCFFILSTVIISHNNSKSNNSLFGELIATSGTSYPDLGAKIKSSVLELFCLLRPPFYYFRAKKAVLSNSLFHFVLSVILTFSSGGASVLFLSFNRLNSSTISKSQVASVPNFFS